RWPSVCPSLGGRLRLARRGPNEGRQQHPDEIRQQRDPLLPRVQPHAPEHALSSAKHEGLAGRVRHPPVCRLKSGSVQQVAHGRAGGGLDLFGLGAHQGYFTSSTSVIPSAFAKRCTTPKVGSYRPASSLLTYSRVIFAFAASAA